MRVVMAVVVVSGEYLLVLVMVLIAGDGMSEGGSKGIKAFYHY